MATPIYPGTSPAPVSSADAGPLPVMAGGLVATPLSCGECQAVEGKSRFLSSGSQTASPALVPLQPQLALWPDHLLGLVLCHLPLPDLIGCRRVCRQWNRVAGQPEMQARAFVKNYPALYRPQGRQRLDVDHARRLLEPWCAGLPPDVAGRRELESYRLQEGLSNWRCFFHLARQMLTTECFDPVSMQRLGKKDWDASRVAFSPDAQWLASAHEIHTDDQHWCLGVGLWRRGQRHWKAVPGFLRSCDQSAGGESRIVHLRFSADSRTLQAFERTGYQRVWQWQPGEGAGDWRPERHRLWHTAVDLVATSGNGRYLAAAVGASLLVYKETGAGVWRQQWEWPWWKSLRRCPQNRGVPPDMTDLVFSHDGRHLLMQGRDELCLAYRSGEDWQEQSLKDEQGQEQGYRWFERGTLAETGTLLGVTASLAATEGAAAMQTESQFTLYRFAEEGRGWWPLTSRHCRRSAAQRVCVVFSPAAREVAFPDQETEAGPRLCVLSASSQPPWAVAVHLSLFSDINPVPDLSGGSWEVVSVQFSANSFFLAFFVSPSCMSMPLSEGSRVRIWKRDGCQGWVTVLLETNDRRFLYPFTWAPDGFHCALSQRRGIDLWGPGPDGRYVKKWSQRGGLFIGRVRFSPDSSLLVTQTVDRLTSWWLGPAAVPPVRTVATSCDDWL
ncbi:MAG: F-box protein [Kistimonas sp.]|nr:F-box protein [Kistimonas sp.]